VAYLVSSVVILAVLTGIIFNVLQHIEVLYHPNMFAFSVESMVSMIVVCCPCSIGLTTSLVSIQTYAQLNSNGIIIKNDFVIENSTLYDSIVFDKTGTLVDNSLEMVDMN